MIRHRQRNRGAGSRELIASLYKLGKSFRTIFLARNLFVTPVHEIRRENLGGGFETPEIDYFSTIIRTCAL